LKELYLRLRSLKKSDWIVIGLIGVLLLILAIPTGQGKDNIFADNDSANAAYDNIYASELEARLVNILSQMEGVGEVSVMITADESDSAKITGVVVVAEGGGDPNVAVQISDAVMTLFKVEAHRIKVIKMSLGG
jgi:stage III sporulation protein AG